MIYPEHISDSRKAYSHFLTVTSLSHFLKPRERWVLFLFLPSFYFAWAFLTWVLHISLHFPIYHIPLIVFHPLGQDGSQWVTCFVYVGILALALAPLYVGVPSAWIKKSLQRRGIVISGRHWHGAEVERIILDEFKSYLEAQRLYNLGAIKQLIENLRDEAAADSRPSLRFWTVLAICFAIIIGFWQPVFSRWLEALVGKDDFVTIVQLVSIGTLGVLQLIIFFLSLIPLRTRREIYLHSLTAIRLELLKTSTRPRLKRRSARPTG